jgi:hypothetical protein
MPFTAKDADAAWKLTPEQEEHINTLSNVTEISTYVRQCGIDNGVVQHLKGYAPDILVDVPAGAPVPQVSAKIGNVTITGTQAEVSAKVTELLSRNATTNDAPPARDPQTGKFVSASDGGAQEDANGAAAAARASENAEIELRWKRGEISGTDYLEKTGALDTYLANQGIDLAAHRKEAKDNTAYAASWADASSQFVKNNPTWPGGEQLMRAVGQQIRELGLEDAPSAESLERAYSAIKIEAEMSACTDKYKLEQLRDRYQREVNGVVPSYRGGTGR